MQKIVAFFLHFHKVEMSRRPYGDYGVSTESPRSAIAFPRCSSWRSTARSRRGHGVLGVATARSASKASSRRPLILF